MSTELNLIFPPWLAAFYSFFTVKDQRFVSLLLFSCEISLKGRKIALNMICGLSLS